MQLKNKASGFTLIELLVVISIIGVLAGLIMVNFNSARERTRDTQRKSDLAQIERSLMMYYNDYGNYPATGTGNLIAGCVPAGTANCSWGSAWAATSGDFYMKILPDDPSSPDQHYSYAQNTNNDFCLLATLENNSDSSIASSQSRCSGCNAVLAVGASDYIICAD
ncbi:prepilin-type N-terminal cleavage/methylation domain-containing protein [Patescibacteria group bacterium]|nr:prepilin-type N-terminal cleavage/methylation domain-containing protein [Patescibacteria group bacterium]